MLKNQIGVNNAGTRELRAVVFPERSPVNGYPLAAHEAAMAKIDETDEANAASLEFDNYASIEDQL